MGRKVILVALAVTLVLSILAPNAFASAAGVVKTPIPDGIVNLRSEPNSDNDFNIIAKVPNGTKIEILSLGSGWHKVKLVKDGKVGYMRDRYIALSDEPLNNGEAIVKTGDVYYVTGASVHLRTGPGLSYDSPTSLIFETRLIMLEYGTSWSKVQVMGQKTTGYISTNYIKQGIWGKTTGTVNLRSLPSLDSRIKREIANDTALTIMVLGPEFSAVIIDNLKGWVSNKYLKH